MELLGLAAITILLTLVFEFVNGFHDSANSIATVVATKVLSPVKAVIWAAVFNFLGIFLSLEVAKTIGKGIIEQQVIIDTGPLLLFCAVMGAIVWDLITWWLAIPTSSSHALVGGLIGAGVAATFATIGTGAIVWSGTTRTIIFIIVSPLVGMIAAFILTVIVMRIGRKRNRTVMNRWFRKLQLASSAFYSYAHGSNDAQKGIGIIAMVLAIEAGTGFQTHYWAMIACGIAISLGTFFGGWRIVKTMATRLTHLDPYQGFCAETGAALMLFGTARVGIPVSTTHTITGAIMGVGATKRMSAVKWGLAGRIVVAWIITIPASALVSAGSYWIINMFYL